MEEATVVLYQLKPQLYPGDIKKNQEVYVRIVAQSQDLKPDPRNHTI